VLRRCEANLGILENMSARKQMFTTQEALGRIWNDSGDEDFNSQENDDESYELASEDKSCKSEDTSSSNEDDIAQDSVESSDEKAFDEGDCRNRVNGVHINNLVKFCTATYECKCHLSSDFITKYPLSKTVIW